MERGDLSRSRPPLATSRPTRGRVIARWVSRYGAVVGARAHGRGGGPRRRQRDGMSSNSLGGDVPKSRRKLIVGCSAIALVFVALCAGGVYWGYGLAHDA